MPAETRKNDRCVILIVHTAPFDIFGDSLTELGITVAVEAAYEPRMHDIGPQDCFMQALVGNGIPVQRPP